MTTTFQSRRRRAWIGIIGMAAVFLPWCDFHGQFAMGGFIHPRDLPEDTPYRVIFVTEGPRDATSHDPAIPDIDEFNSFVTEQAASLSSQLPGLTWKAIASTTDVDAKDNVGETSADIPIYNTQGYRVADNWADLWDNDALYHAIGYDQYGDPATDVFVWTGTKPDGTKENTGPGIIGPLGSDAFLIGFGSPTFVNYKWIERGTLRDNTESHSFYALSNVIPAPVPEPGTAMLLSAAALYALVFAYRQRRKNKCY